MTRRPGPPGPPDHPERRTTPLPPRRDVRRPPPRQPQWPPPLRPAQWQPPRRPPPAQPQRPPAQPWYLEHRRPPAPEAQPLPRAAPPPSPPPNQAGPQPQSNRALLVGAGITGLLALAVLLALALRGVIGGSGPIELDITHAQDDVRRVLIDPINGYGRDDVTDVRCNNGVNPRVRRGATFTCTVTVDGAQRQVLAEFSDDAGTYAVDRPR